MTITKADRDAIIDYVTNHTQYDERTVRISKDGDVSAVLDADKTFNGPETVRVLLGRVDEYLAEIREWVNEE